MLGETFLLECLSVLILLQLLQTSSTNYNAQCNPSACGWIPDIRYPFRLKGDPESCGDSRYELVCENNTASLYLNSQKYYVQAIDYQNFTIRLSDAALENSTCSFPQYSLFESHFNGNSPYSVYSLKSPKSPHFHKISWPITFMSCPYPINSSFSLETAHCGNRVFDSNASYSSTRRYKYVKVGNLNASDVRDMCSIDLIVMTSWPFKDVNNLSLSDIHSSLLYGFELSWLTVTIIHCKMKNSCSLCGNYSEGTFHFCLYDQHRSPWYDALEGAFEVVLQLIAEAFAVVYNYITGKYREKLYYKCPERNEMHWSTVQLIHKSSQGIQSTSQSPIQGSSFSLLYFRYNLHIEDNV